MGRNKYNVDEELKTEFNMKHLKRLLRYLLKYRVKLFLSVLLMLIASIASLIGPYLIKDAIDVKIPAKDAQGLMRLSIIFAFTLVVSGICLKYKIRLMSNVGQGVIHNIRSDLFYHLQELPFQYFDNRPHGKILVRVVNYVNSLSDLLSNGIINSITDMFSLFVIVVFMILISLRLTLICMAGIPILAIAVFFIQNAQRKAWQLTSSKTSNMNAYLHESICGMKVTQSFAREKESLDIYKELSNDYRKAWLRAVSIQFLLWPAVENVSMLTIAAVYVAGIAWVDRGVTVGVLIAFVGYIWRFWAPITNLGNFYNGIIQSMAYLERIFETMDEKKSIDDRQGAYEMPSIQGKVDFDAVTFSYDGKRTILDNISFHVQKGECMAIVGATGCGKSTIVNLLSRFYNVNTGKILIDGIDISEVTLKSLRRQMGIMQQESFIFSGTIMENIRYGRLDATDDEVIEAAKAVKAHDFIMEMEKGYQTEINERGTRLSVGQRQLISFARTLLADPSILVLDEATSSIDTKTEMMLQQGLEKLLENRTSFIIAHRLSTIKNATRIIYIDQGKIVEEGTHEELLNKKGAYYKLYSAQFKLLVAI